MTDSCSWEPHPFYVSEEDVAIDSHEANFCHKFVCAILC